MSDLISRQAAIDAVVDLYWMDERLLNFKKEIDTVFENIKNLPSAQPNTDEWCTDCKEYDHDRHCCPRWNRVIRETLKDAQPEIIRCEHCYHALEEGPKLWCTKGPISIRVNPTHFCGFAERREDERNNTER